MGERSELSLIVLLSFLCVNVFPQICSESYISYTIPIETNWQYPLGNTFQDKSPYDYRLPFTFSFYGNSYDQITVSSNGFITFCCGNRLGNASTLPSIDTGESIWLWYMDFGFSNIQVYTVGETQGKRIFVVLYENVPANSVNLDPAGPDLCSSSLTGQIRLYEVDNSIEIEIRRAPILYNNWVFSGIHSDKLYKTIYLLPPTKFNYGGFPWDNYPLGLNGSIQPSPGWTRTQCPTPIAARFECIVCTSDKDCAFPLPKSGSPLCTTSNPTCVPVSPLLNLVDQGGLVCEHPFESNDSIPAITANSPNLLDWRGDPICPSSLGCCSFGPMTYYPPQHLLDLCDLPDIIEDCYDAINSLFCSSCTTTPSQPFWKNFTNGPFYYITRDFKDKIDGICGTVANPQNTSDCSSSVFDWPDFPFVVTPGCTNSPMILTSRTGTFDDGSGPNYYENNLNCYWHINFDANFISEIYISFNFLNTEVDVDCVIIENGTRQELVSFNGTYGPDALEYTVYSNEMYIHFVTDKSVVGQGFSISYEGIVSLNEDENWIITSDIGFPLAAQNENDGSPLIISQNQSSVWQLWENFDTYNDTVYVINDFTTGMYVSVDNSKQVFEAVDDSFDDPENWILKSHPIYVNRFAIKSFFNNMVLFYNNVSDAVSHIVTLAPLSNNPGAWWTLSVLPKASSCDGAQKSQTPCSNFGIQNYTTLAGTFDDGGDGTSDGYYVDGSYCVWMIHVPEAIRIQIQFCSFNTEDGYDIVYIFDGLFNTSNFVTEFTGDYDENNLPSWTSTSNIVSVVFVSDGSVPESGFILSYSSLLERGPICPSCSSECIVVSNSRPAVCTCPDGYSLDLNGKNCTEIDECFIGMCQNASNCTNYPGGYTCHCPPGWLLDSLNSCHDQDECALGTHNCQQICIKTLDPTMSNFNSPRYTCGCNVGYYLAPNKTSCLSLFIETPTDGSAYQSLFSLQLPCNNDVNIAKLPGINFIGCNAVVDNTTTVKKCQLPFITSPHDTLHYQCYTPNNIDLPLCATEIGKNFMATEIGTCFCTGKNTNVGKGNTALITSSYGTFDESTLVDGNTDPSNAYLFQPSSYWWLIVSPPSVLTYITIYGCPSCYQNQSDPYHERFSLTYKFYKDFFISEPITLTKTYNGLTLTNDTILVPLEATLFQTLILEITGRYYDTFYLTEIEPFANVPLSPPPITECAMQLSRSKFDFLMNGSIPDQPLIFVNDMVINANLGLRSYFSFTINPGSTDMLSYVFYEASGNLMQVLFDGVSNVVSILQNDIVKATANLNSPSVGNPISLTDGAIHYATIVYSPPSKLEKGILSLSLDSAHILLETNVSIPSGSNYSVGFEVSSSSQQKRSNTDTGSFIFYTWNVYTLQIIVSSPTSTSSSLVTILGIFFGILLIVIIILAILFILRKKNSADNLINVESLPREMIRHYRQFSKKPNQWNIQKDGLVSFYLKELKMGSKDYTQMLYIWEELGGNVYNIEKAYAVHSPSLLGVFTTKVANLTAQVQAFKKGFVSESWKNELDVKGLRQWTHDEYQKLVKRFPWNNSNMASVVCALHGTSEESAHAISRTGFAALGLEDPGYYGKGMYFTTKAKYTFQYIFSKPTPTLLVCFVVTGNAYPVIEHPLKQNSMMKQALIKGYQSHYVLTRVDGYPCPEIERDPNLYFDEIVIEQEASILPYYIVTINKNNFLKLGEESRKAQEEIKRAEGNKEDSERDTSLKQSRNTAKKKSREGQDVKNSRLKEEDLKNSRLKEEDLKYSRLKEEDLKNSRLKEEDLKSSRLKEKDLKNSRQNRKQSVPPANAPEEVIKVGGKLTQSSTSSSD